MTKYRRKTLSHELLGYLKTAFTECLAAWNCKLIEFGGESDHVHLLIDIHPALDISVLINNLKTASARRARATVCEHSAPFYWKPLFWQSLLCLQRGWCDFGDCACRCGCSGHRGTRKEENQGALISAARSHPPCLEAEGGWECARVWFKDRIWQLTPFMRNCMPGCLSGVADSDCSQCRSPKNARMRKALVFAMNITGLGI